MNALVRTGNRLVDLSKLFTWLPPLAARIIMASVFIGSGWGKLQNLERVAGFFGSVGIPAPGFMAPFVGTVELVAGILLLAGLGTRLAAIPLVVVMIVALSAVVGPQLEGLRALYATQEFLFILLLLWLIVAGPGKVSLDAFVARKHRA